MRCQHLPSALGPFLGMVQKRPFSGNTRDLSADPDRSRVNTVRHGICITSRVNDATYFSIRCYDL